ncbi:MAG: 30S ribosomal protein S12 methylthiotransferase RimO, partial [Myxococcota bacterium]
MKKVHVVSLGCPKNRVDSEVMLGHLGEDGYVHVDDPEVADVLVVNTCAFIDSAKEESVDAILDAAEIKSRGNKRLVVAGCLSQRYAPDLAKEIPEVDHFIGTGNIEQIREVLAESGRPSLPIVGQPTPHPRLRGRNPLRPYRHEPASSDEPQVFIPDPDFTIRADSPRVSSQAFYTHYLKVSEGCSNSCAFCIIPKLRGPQRSRTIEDIVREAEARIDAGTVELNLIAQDLCAYGKDRSEGENLAKLLRALNKTASQASQPVWIRCMYAYPRGMTRDVIDTLANSEHVVPYLDMPLQHISDRLLRSMKRGKGGEATWDLLRRLRAAIPGLTLRTTFITGLPGETDEDFDELVRFVEELRFERMGVFTYSPEEDTPAATMDHQIPAELALERQQRLMALQQEISADQQEALVGQTLQVLVEGVSEETELLLQG